MATKKDPAKKVATKKAPAKKVATKKAPAKAKAPVINNMEVIAGAVIKSLPDQKGRRVNLVSVGNDKYQVIKERTGYSSAELSLADAEKEFSYQRLNPHSK